MLVSGVQFRRLSRVFLATLALVSVQANVALAQDAQGIYVQRCAPCHGPHGKGDGLAGKMLNPPPKDFATALNGWSSTSRHSVHKVRGENACSLQQAQPGSINTEVTT